MTKLRAAMAVLALGAAGALAGCGGNNSTAVTYTRLDRSGAPAMNAGIFTDTTRMATFNLGDPTTDVTTWDSTLFVRVAAMRASAQVLGPADFPGIGDTALVTAILPDVITLDFSLPVQYPNGRRLGDDVMDYDLGRILNRGNTLTGGPGIPDGITAATKSKQFLATFPYLATPNQGGP